MKEEISGYISKWYLKYFYPKHNSFCWYTVVEPARGACVNFPDITLSKPDKDHLKVKITIEVEEGGPNAKSEEEISG